MKLWTSLRIAYNEEDAVRSACPKGKKWLRIIKETPFFMNIPESERMSSKGKGACRRDMTLGSHFLSDSSGKLILWYKNCIIRP